MIAMDNKDAGHVPRAYVIKKPGADVIEGEIYDHVAGRCILADNKTSFMLCGM